MIENIDTFSSKHAYHFRAQHYVTHSDCQLIASYSIPYRISVQSIVICLLRLSMCSPLLLVVVVVVIVIIFNFFPFIILPLRPSTRGGRPSPIRRQQPQFGWELLISPCMKIARGGFILSGPNV